MLTKRTQMAIDLLHEIAYHSFVLCPVKGESACCPAECSYLLGRLCAAGIIRPASKSAPDCCCSYALNSDLGDITLYRLLLAIGETVNLMSPLTDEERIYKHYHYGTGALKLGVVNQTLRTLLCDIHVTDF